MILITGGAGFIGLHLTRRLLADGTSVRILDNFHPQIHAGATDLPGDLAGHVDLIRGDVRDRTVVAKALDGVAAVVHLAAETGTGQSMYEVERYFAVNVQGTAVLLEALHSERGGRAVERLVVASSRAIYGEGAYRCDAHGIVFPPERSPGDLDAGQFEPKCSICMGPAQSIPTPESAPLQPLSVYGLTKQMQEQAVLLLSRGMNIPAVALRYQNVYGPGQSLKNPYTGILAVFSTLARAARPIEVYEDGNESRDFVYVSDVVEATAKAINDTEFVGPMNVGSGRATCVLDVAKLVNQFFGSSSEIRVTGAYRAGDIRHNRADLSTAERVLKFEPHVAFAAGLREFLEWAMAQESPDHGSYEKSVAELTARGLLRQTKS